ncbi:MAG: putative selenium-dependent hydroxylase accessory protein YqeC [Chloroflexi bacterium]|nr:putative selenium-dependent hydroxylase accessory protein YqeC [Chloroflexota bacterium]
MELIQALRLGPQARLALVGAGGKTTALFQIARELGGKVLVSASTHLAKFQFSLADKHFIIERHSQIAGLVQEIIPGVNLIIGSVGEDGRAGGLDAKSLDKLHKLAAENNWPLLIEADGSRQRPLKAPAEHEPAIPDFVTTVVVVAGLSGLGMPLGDEHVHRPKRFAQLAGLSLGEKITSQVLVKVLSHKQGGLKNIPAQTRKLLLMNQVNTPEKESHIQNLAGDLLKVYEVVVAADLGTDLEKRGVVAVYQPVAGVVLAGGGSTRLGEPKQLLDWKGQPFVRHIAQIALEAGLSPVVVVTGAHANKVNEVLSDLPITITNNPIWQQGQSTSVKTGLRSLPAETGAVIFIVVDKPQIPVTLLRALISTHANTMAPIVAPQVNGQRANPVLFDRITFQDLENINGDVGGRAIFPNYRVTWVPWLDSSLEIDVNTLSDYHRLIDSESAT